jgi:nicotinate-nucleotide pyrophosphorylase (carboxylating)
MLTDSDKSRLDAFLKAALEEDLGTEGDVTTLSVLARSGKGEGILVSKEKGVIAGLPVFERVFTLLDDSISVDLFKEDGLGVDGGERLGRIRGDLSAILRGERTALNLLQRLSGVATLTRRFVESVRGTGAVILDTRKTTPGMRFLEKYAVRMGGGQNHRHGLYDMILIKDNHIAAAGGIEKAISSCLKWIAHTKKDLAIEVETRTLEEVESALRFPVQRIMLDNMDLNTMRQAVAVIGGKTDVEASGNMDLETVREVAMTGVDYISVGALTHSAPSLDISLNFLP